MKIMFVTSVTVGLAEGIIDDTCLVLYSFVTIGKSLLLNENQFKREEVYEKNREISKLIYAWVVFFCLKNTTFLYNTILSGHDLRIAKNISITTSLEC